MALRITRDLLAVIVTSAFLGWVVATFFGPMLLHIYIDEQGWPTLFGLDLLVAGLCVVGYTVIRERVPALPPSHFPLTRAAFLVFFILNFGATMTFVLLFLGILPRDAELVAIVPYGLGLVLLFRQRLAKIG